jgi:hypothetical protein
MPRITGRLAPAPKWLDVMPGWCASVSPSVDSRARTSSAPPSDVTGVIISSCTTPRALADTTTVGTLSGSAAMRPVVVWAWTASGAPKASISARVSGVRLQVKCDMVKSLMMR